MTPRIIAVGWFFVLNIQKVIYISICYFGCFSYCQH
uniref:Uncharacterized protein n=1 Tax=Lepeophtheirus salmonis TaxID=72036 RepID=A0A0K2T8P0_LEPSM